ncbi:restriction endonuclease subunit S [Streptococcus parasanguinis]|uniref:Restriction endonuclease subunit S n=1 Tax=Streptococcus parasanguinis TaxID=1318 RepID=A0AAJ1HD37_STRPA|nr:restriction endonuclease subunit S [Streptococcus parasanguinis]MDB8620080.1 restriction endonuclease subunit S [Streptococcus parasanguinis]
MREMKDSGIDWINNTPATWEIKRIKAVLVERNESNNPVKTDFILSLTNDRGVIPYADKGEIGNKSKDDLSGYKLAYPNDIVLNSMNVFIGSVALSSYYGCVSPVYYMLYTRYKKDNIKYYNYLFQTQELQKKLHGYGNGIMDIRMRIQMSKLNTVMIPIPPSEEQHKIADYLDKKCSKIDAIIEKQQTVIEKLKAYKLSKINELIVEVEGQSIHLGHIANMKNGLNFNAAPNGKPLKFLGVGDFKDYFVLDREDMFSDILIDEEIDEDYMLKDGDIVFVRSNGSKELVGRAVMVENIDFPLSYSGFCIRFRNIRTDILNDRYLLYFFRSPYFREQLKKYSQGSNINNINQVLLSQISITVPSIEIQKRAIDDVERLSYNLDKTILGKQALIDKLIAYKKSLIYEVVTGKKEI